MCFSLLAVTNFLYFFLGQKTTVSEHPTDQGQYIQLDTVAKDPKAEPQNPLFAVFLSFSSSTCPSPSCTVTGFPGLLQNSFFLFSNLVSEMNPLEAFATWNLVFIILHFPSSYFDSWLFPKGVPQAKLDNPSGDVRVFCTDHQCLTIVLIFSELLP